MTPFKKVIILFGAPGAGKGTQAGLLSEKLELYYLETSKLLEKEFKNPSREIFEIDGEEFKIDAERRLWRTGILCSPPFVTQIMKEAIQRLFDEGESLIMAGSPRTIYEAEKIVPFLKGLFGNNIKAFLINISPEQTIFRNSNRKICELMRHPIIFNEETKNLTLCPLDGSRLQKREGLDDPKSIKVRLEEYKNRTVPIFDILEKEGIEIKKINGEQSVADVHNDIFSQINDQD